VKAILDECRRTWRRLGVPRAVRQEMAEELEADLAAAAADGVRPEDFVAGDVRVFAEAWARERGAVKPRLLLGSTVAAAVIGLVPGAVFGLFAAYGMSSDAFAQTFGSEIRVGENHYEMYYEPPPWLLLGLYGLGAVFAYAGAVCAVAAALRWRGDQALKRTVRALVTALPAGTVLAIAATMVFAWSRNFSTEAPTVVAEALVALATFSTVVAGVRVWSVRRERSRGRPFRPAVDAAVEPL
jgi:hypothetical protein